MVPSVAVDSGCLKAADLLVLGIRPPITATDILVGNAKAPLPGTWYLPGAPRVVTFAYKDTGYYTHRWQVTRRATGTGSLTRSESSPGLRSAKAC